MDDEEVEADRRSDEGGLHEHDDQDAGSKAAEESGSLSPRFLICGIAKVPTVAAVVEPEVSANSVEVPILACIRPPGSQERQRLMARCMRSARPTSRNSFFGAPGKLAGGAGDRQHGDGRIENEANPAECGYNRN